MVLPRQSTPIPTPHVSEQRPDLCSLATVQAGLGPCMLRSLPQAQDHLLRLQESSLGALPSIRVLPKVHEEMESKDVYLVQKNIHV